MHDAADRFLLRFGLMSRHWLTSRNSIIVKIVRWPASVPDFMRQQPDLECLFVASLEPMSRYLVSGGKVQLDRGRTSGVKNPAGTFDRVLQSLSYCSFFGNSVGKSYHG